MNFKLLLLELGFSISQEISILCDCFRLDPVLKKACQNDVKVICNAPNLDDQDSYPSSLVISCLYRHVALDTEAKVRTAFTAFLSSCQFAICFETMISCSPQPHFLDSIMMPRDHVSTLFFMCL